MTYGSESGPSEGTSKFSAWTEKFPFGDGLAAWISWLPSDFMQKHFVESAPQLRQEKLVEKWLKQVVKQEDNYDYVLESRSEEGINETFIQKWSATAGDAPSVISAAEGATPQISSVKASSSLGSDLPGMRRLDGRCPKCGARFYPINTVDRPCWCDPTEIRDLLAARVEDYETQHLDD